MKTKQIPYIKKAEILAMSESERERQIDRERERDRERQIDRERETDIQIDRQID